VVYYNDDTCSLHLFATKYATIDRQIRERLDRIPLSASKLKALTSTLTLATPKSLGQGAVASKHKEVSKVTDVSKGSGEGNRPAYTCFNC
jgi:hypothetical protein